MLPHQEDNHLQDSMQNSTLERNGSTPRKQNVACDACRQRKVKCNKVSGQDKCQHCLSKNYPCTHYAQKATSEKMRTLTISRRPPRNLSGSSKYTSPILSNGQPQGNGQEADASAPSSPSTSKISSTGSFNGSALDFPFPQALLSSTTPPAGINRGAYPPPQIAHNTPTRDILAYLFAPPDVPSSELSSSLNQTRISSYADWGDMAHRLEDDDFRVEFAHDLVDVFFQIVHTRLPLLNPNQFRTRLNLPAHQPQPRSQSQTRSQSQSQSQSRSQSLSESPLHPALIATVLAWGSKFSEHPLLVADRGRRPSGHCHLARALIDRARELAEKMKVHRMACTDHIVISLLIEPLQNQCPEDPSGFHGFWVTAATRHLMDLKLTHKSVLSAIADSEARGTMVFAWWMCCLADAYRSAYYRRKPLIDDEDYDIDFYTADPISAEMSDAQSPTVSPREQLEILGYYRAAHALARISRLMSKNLWRPSTDSDGIPFDLLYRVTNLLTDWRDEYLASVGVPSNFQADWDFISAVSACCSDATYHVMWIILFNAVDDFGVREVVEANRAGNHAASGTRAHIESVKRKVAEEALHGALRISVLAGVLTSNGYLKLDPAVMHVSISQSGTLLARLGRPEVANCISGLEQYSYSYEETGEQAAEMGRVYNLARAGEVELKHMAGVAPRVSVALEAEQAAMVVEGERRNGDQPESYPVFGH